MYNLLILRRNQLTSSPNLNVLNYFYFNEICYYFDTYDYYKNFLFILDWTVLLSKPTFSIECSRVPKKYKKKLKKKYIYSTRYLPHNLRMKNSINYIKFEIRSSPYQTLLNRTLNVYLDMILNYKMSSIYKKKILVYKKIFKI